MIEAVISVVIGITVLFFVILEANKENPSGKSLLVYWGGFICRRIAALEKALKLISELKINDAI